MLKIGGLLICREHTLDANDITDSDLKPNYRGTSYKEITADMIKPETLQRVGTLNKSFIYVEYDKTPPGFYAQE